MTNLRQLTQVCVLIAASSLCAQETVGEITGIVRGPDRSPVAGATVTFSSPVLLGPRSTTTDAQGRYRMRMLLPGAYTVRVVMQGYIGSQVTNIRVSSGSIMNADLNLRSIEAQTEVVDIVGTSAALDKTESRVASTFTAQDLSNITRGSLTGLYAATVFAPGVTGRDIPQIRGGTGGSAQALLNGVPMRNPTSGQPRQYEMLTDDMIEDIQLIQNPINAKYGFFSSGMITVSTITGSNTFKGLVKVQMVNPAWRTYNNGPFPNRFGEAIQGTRTSDPWYSNNIAEILDVTQDDISRYYHIVLSGPIIKDKLTFAYASRIQPNRTNYDVRMNVLGANQDANRTFLPGLTSGDPRFSGPSPINPGTQSEAWAAHYWGANPLAPTRPLPVWSTGGDPFNSYKLFWQISSNHQIDFNYSDNPYKNPYPSAGYLGEEMSNQAFTKRMTRAFNYKGILGNGVLSAGVGSRYNNATSTVGPDDPLYVSLWNQDASGLLERNGRASQTVSAGAAGSPSLNASYNYNLDYNYIWENHNFDVGLQRLEEVVKNSPPGINGLRFYSPGRYHDGRYVVFNVQDPSGPLWTEGSALNMTGDASLAARRNYLMIANAFVPMYIDSNDVSGRDPETLGTSTSFYINDNWTLSDSWAFNFGLRVDNSKYEDMTGERANSTSIVPRVRAQWDMDGNNKHVLSFSFTQSRASLAMYNMGTFSISGSNAMQRRYAWNQGTVDPYLVNYSDIKNRSNYGYYVQYTDAAMAWKVDPDFKPELTTSFDFTYRRAFEEGGFFRVSMVYNTTKDLAFAEARDVAIELADPTGAIPEMAAAYDFERYLYNRSDRKRTYTGAEMEWMMPLLDRSSYKLTWNGNWTIAKATGNQSYTYGNAGTQGSDYWAPLYFDQLAKIGMPKDLYDPWGEAGGIPRHMARTWLTYTHGTPGGTTNIVTLTGLYESGSPAVSTMTYSLPTGTWANATTSGGLVASMPAGGSTSYSNTNYLVVFPWGPIGTRKNYSQHRVDLQWNVNVPIKRTLSIFMEIMVGQIFNSYTPLSHITDWTTGRARVWNMYNPNDPNWVGDPLMGVRVANTATGERWGVPFVQAVSNSPYGQRRYFAGGGLANFTTGQFDIGIRF